MPRWYCASNGQQQGPFDEGQVRDMIFIAVVALRVSCAQHRRGY